MKYGYRINARWKDNPRLYWIWQKMLDRCCNENHIRHNAYKNVSVCERWFCFDYFLEDVSKIEGWDETKFNNKKLELDKDLKQKDKKYKIYSLATCIWIDKKINNKYQLSHITKPFIAISPNGEQYYYDSINQCARENNLPPGSISHILHKSRKTIYGWTFFYK